MQTDFLFVLGHIVGALLVLSFGTVIPGLAVIRILDPTADRFRQVMLTPAIGLLLLLGLSGWTVLIIGEYSSSILVLLIIAINGLGISIIESKSTGDKENLSSWLKLEKAMGIIRDESEEENEFWSEETWSEVEEQRLIQKSRPHWWYWPIGFSVIVSLAPLFLFQLPHGVDWIGFASLGHSFATSGSLSLPPPSLGNWTYPPAFPAVSALLEQSLNISPEFAGHLLARIGILCLLMGIVGCCDRWGGGVQTLVAMGLAAGIFAKAHDSGWPTVLSQLGLILGLLVVIRPAGNRRKEHDFAFAIGVLSVSVIHPTGAIYLGTLLAANLLIRQLHDREDELAIRIVTISAIMLAAAAAVTFLIFAPRILEDAVFAEYGWQGGWPMLIYTSPLLPIAIYCGWKLRNTVEGAIVLTWILLQWILTLIHLLDGVSIPVLNLFSLSLYSMGLHGFHIPAAVLLGMAFSNGVVWTEIDTKEDFQLDEMTENESDFLSKENGFEVNFLGWGKKSFVAISIVSLLLVSGSTLALFQLGNHAELFAVTKGDREIASALHELPDGSIVYAENSHWGHIYDVPEGIGITTFPTLGLVDVDYSMQAEATRAIRHDDTQSLVDLGITHAISSPIGGLVWELSDSPHWKIIEDIHGSRLWEFSATPAVASEGWFTTPEKTDCEESINCQWRKDNWYEQRRWKHDDFSSMRPFISSGQISWNATPSTNLPGNLLTLSMLFECSEETEMKITLQQEDWQWEQNVRCKNGWGYAKDNQLEGLTLGQIAISVEISGGGELWINPLGLSGRGDRIIDESGAKLHWLELRQGEVLQ